MHCHAEKKARALSDLNRTAAYRFGQPDPGRPPDLGRPGSAPQPRPVSLFLEIHFDDFEDPCKFEIP
jgi:hypothetical protein